MSRTARYLPRFFALALLTAGLLVVSWSSGVAHALPPAETDTVDVSGQVSITSRTGQESIALTGTATVQLAAPHTKGSVEANDAEITAISLSGNSITGPVTVTESPSSVSNGEIRSISDGSFPATSYFNVYAVMVVPASPSPSITLHNDVPIVMSVAALYGWPPSSATYTATPSPCVLLQPSISNPAQICVTGASFTLSSPNAVGGLTELASMPVDEGERVDNTTGNDHVVGAAVVLALLATGGLAAGYARRKLRSNR
jgi:hypothetical protein